MALVGPITINGSTGNSNWAFKTVVTETAIDTVKKTSTVKVENFLGRTNSTSYFMGTYTNSFEVAGQKFSETIYKSSGDIAAGKFVSLGAHTFTVTQTTTPLTITVKGSYSTSAFTPNGASSSGSVTLSKLHEAPLLTHVDFLETNSVLTSIGVPNDTFVPHLSIKKATANVTLYDNATLTKTRLINGTNVFESTASAPAVVTMDFTKNNLIYYYSDFQEKNMVDLYVEVTDSTGASAKYGYPNTWVTPYVKPNIIQTSSSVKRNGQVSGKVNLNLTGTFYNDKIGTKSNTITLSYKYWKKGTTEPTTYYTIPSNAYTISGNNISMKNWNVTKNGTVITDVAKDSVYLFKIKATDAFNQTSEIELTCAKGEWLMAKFKDRVDFKRITQQGVNVATKNDTQRHLMYLRINSSQTLTWSAWTDVLVPLELVNTIGTKLTYDSNCVKIGAGVKKVRVTGNIKWDAAVASGAVSAKVRVVKLDGSVEIPTTTFNQKVNTTVDHTEVIPETIVNVSEGYKIGLAFQTGTANTSKTLKASSNLVVEVLE